MSLAISLLWALAAAGFAWHCAVVARHVTYVTLADGRKQARSIPLLFRLLLPFAPNFKGFFRGKSYDRRRDELTRQLISGGFEGLLSAEEVLALQVMLPIFPGVFWILFAGASASATVNPFLHRTAIAACICGPLWLYVYPVMWLRRAVVTRHNLIRRALPFVLDLLTLSVEAGMDFMTALQRNVERAKIDALAEELIRVIREIQLGKTRREALRDMSRRVNLADLRSVVNALVQADELGVSIGSILRIQSDQIRQRRFERAERLANEAPVKMLFPLLLFIFPAVFLILLGPVLNRMFQQGAF
jgi:tight adherence protein C